MCIRDSNILTKENIEYDQKVVAKMVESHFPDFRRVINELQRYSATGKIDTGVLSVNSNVSVKELYGHIKSKSFSNVRKWCAEHVDTDVNTIFRQIYDVSSEHMASHSIAQLVLIIADYQYKASFVADQEINLVACITEIMANCEFK